MDFESINNGKFYSIRVNSDFIIPTDKTYDLLVCKVLAYAVLTKFSIINDQC